MNIVGKKITLRAIEESDLELLHQWSNDPEIWYLLGGWHFPVSLESMKIWFEALNNNKFNQRLVSVCRAHIYFMRINKLHSFKRGHSKTTGI